MRKEHERLLAIEIEKTDKGLKRNVGVVNGDWGRAIPINCIVLDTRFKESFVISYGNEDINEVAGLKTFISERNRQYEIDYMMFLPEKEKRNGFPVYEEAYEKMKERATGISIALGLPFYDLTKEDCCERCKRNYPVEESKAYKKHIKISFADFKEKGLATKFTQLEKESNKQIQESNLCRNCLKEESQKIINDGEELYKSIKYPNKNKETNKREYIPAKLRIEILNESARYVDEFNKTIPCCSFCGTTAKETSLHIDHIVPVSKGGKTEKENLQVLCEQCNLQKSNKHVLIINT